MGCMTSERVNPYNIVYNGEAEVSSPKYGLRGFEINKTRSVNKPSVAERTDAAISDPPDAVSTEDLDRVINQEEIDARARVIAKRLMKQHAKTWAEVAKY